jgi:hypothetical protein
VLLLVGPEPSAGGAFLAVEPDRGQLERPDGARRQWFGQLETQVRFSPGRRLAGLLTGDMAPTENRAARDHLLGAWELVSWQSLDSDGTVVGYPLGEDAIGQIMYDGASGRVSAQLAAVNQPRFASDDWQDATSEEMVSAWPRYFGCFGRFTVDEDAGAVVHHIESGWFPNLVGTDQVRYYSFEDDQLVLDGETTWGTVRIIWRRANELDES